MAISAGDDALASDFVVEGGLPAQDGKGLKLDSNGVVDKSVIKTAYFGDGGDGASAKTGATTFNSVKTSVDTLSSSGQAVLSVAATASFSVGDRVFIHQTRGTGSGLWEIGEIESIDAGVSLTLKNNLVNSYQSTGAQVILIPEYTELLLKTGTTIADGAWDGIVGGIVVVYASKGIIIEDDVVLLMNDKGFRGGNIDGGQAEGTGGGIGIVNNVNEPNENGGGGGGVGANAGQGGRKFIDDQSVVFSDRSLLIMGGGGGAGSNTGFGDGGVGGGIVIFITPSFINFGTITANGEVGANATAGGDKGGGGGGGGGTIAIFANQIYNRVTPTVTAGAGGTGQGTTWWGGGGGGNALTGSDGGSPNGGTGAVGYLIEGMTEELFGL